MPAILGILIAFALFLILIVILKNTFPGYQALGTDSLLVSLRKLIWGK